MPVALSDLFHVAYVFTLPLTSNVQSPAGMIIPALAVAESAKTAPAAVFLYANLS
jgi:hypothetical protein